MVDIGAIEPVKRPGEIDPSGPTVGLNPTFGGDLQQGLTAKLERAIEAFLMSTQVDDDIDVDAMKPDDGGEPGRTGPEPVPVVDRPDAPETPGDLAQRMAATIRDCGDDLVRRASDLNALGQNAVNTFVQRLFADQDLDATIQAGRQQLGTAADEARAAFTRMARDIDAEAPGAAATVIIDSINANAQTIDAAAAEAAALEELGYAAGTTVDQLAARSGNADLGVDERQAAEFDAKLATVIAQVELDQQLAAAQEHVAAEILQINPASRVAKLAETLIDISEFDPPGSIEATPVEVRDALADYFLELARTEKSVNLARDVVGQLLEYANRPDDPGDGRPSGAQMLDYLVEQAQDQSFTKWVAQAMSDDAEIRSRADQRILAALTDDDGPQRSGGARVSPLRDLPDDQQGPGTAAFDLKVAEVSDAVKAALLGLSDLKELVEHHAESRLTNVYAMLDQIDGLKGAGRLGKDEPVAVGGAYYQLGKGASAELTQAAHEAPGQLYVGIDQAQLSKKSPDERAPYRLDSRITDEQDLALLARIQAAATDVVPGFVNEVDSLWETKGLRDALQKAADYLVKQDADNLLALQRAYDVFHREADDALQRAYDHLVRENEARAQSAADAAQTQSVEESKLRDKLAVIEEYRQVLERIDAARARDLMYEWIERAGRFGRGPHAGAR